MVITTPALAPGFQLAGVETFAAADFQAAETILRQLLDGHEASLIIVPQELLPGLDPQLQRQLENSIQPVVMGIPSDLPATSGESRRHYISELIRRAIGFHITFGAEKREDTAG
jgi:vacuolar-type H+-ATPase subunit F/Vma7